MNEWQTRQAAACSCRGSDELCPCQNVDRSAPKAFELMVPVSDDGWTEWIHPLPGYQMKCCDCGLVHEMEFAIVPSHAETGEFNEGEGADAVIVFRARRGDFVPSPSAPAAPCPSPEMGEGR